MHMVPLFAIDIHSLTHKRMKHACDVGEDYEVMYYVDWDLAS